MILLLPDKLGITPGYQDIWAALLFSANIPAHQVTIRSVWTSAATKELQLLIKKGNRKAPGFNPDERIQAILNVWVHQTIQAVKPSVIMCSDAALLGLVEPDWNLATIDTMRGGVYEMFGIPTVIITPISAVNSQKKPKDISTLNAGAESKHEFEEEEHEDDEFFIEPYTIPFGRIVLAMDLRKVYRIWMRVNAAAQSGNPRNQELQRR